MSLRQVHINEDRENSSGYNFCSVTVNMKLWISCIFLIFRVANISMFTCSKSRSHPQLKKKIQKPAAALVKAKICQFSSTFLAEFDFIPQSWTYEFGYRSIMFPAPCLGVRSACGQGIFVTPVLGLSKAEVLNFLHLPELRVLNILKFSFELRIR